MHHETRAMFAEVRVQKARVGSRTVISKGSDGATDEIVAFI